MVPSSRRGWPLRAPTPRTNREIYDAAGQQHDIPVEEETDVMLLESADIFSLGH